MIIAGLDIGSKSVRLVVGELAEEGITLIDLIQVPSEGVKKGVVVNLETITQCIRNAVLQVVEKHDIQIQEVILGLSGVQIIGQNSKGVVAIESRQKGVTASDIERVLEAASAVPMTLDHEIIHRIPNEYTIDGKQHASNPINMLGVRLELNVHIIAVSSTGAQGLVMAANRAGLVVSHLMYCGYASSKVVLTADEYSLGAIHIVIGHDTTTVLCVKDGGVCSSFVIPIGGKHITNDLAIVLQTSVEEAERIKLQHGVCCAGVIDSNEEVLIQGIGIHRPRLSTQLDITRIIEARMREILCVILNFVQRSGLKIEEFHTVVLGGGGSLHIGITELVQQELNIAARVGIPKRMSGLDANTRTPFWSTALGLLIDAREALSVQVKKQKKSHGVVSWIRNFFE